jgi:hypothetical protein
MHPSARRGKDYGGAHKLEGRCSLLPTVRETPAVEVLVTKDAPSALGPLGIKSVGEGGITEIGVVTPLQSTKPAACPAG